jgi:hypothetical protein
MKIRLILFVLLLVAAAAQATIRTVSSDGLAQFAQVQPAIDAANSGDTVLVYPVGVYPGFNVTKKLVIMGAGTENQPFRGTKITGVVTVTGAADSSELRSFWVQTSANAGAHSPASAVLQIASQCKALLVWRCLLENNGVTGNPQDGANVGDSSQVSFIECGFWNSQNSNGNAFAVIMANSSVVNMEGSVGIRLAGTVQGGVATGVLTVRNCLFEGINAGAGGFNTSASGFVQNCATISMLLVQSAPFLSITFSTQNVANSNFVSYVQWNPQTSDYHLATGSVLINAGDPSSPLDLDGSTADKGAYGGQHPYVANGAPDFPFVFELQAPTSVPQDGSLPVYSRGRIGPGN